MSPAALPDQVQQLADQWLALDADAASRAEVQRLVAEEQAGLLEDILARRLQFGAAGGCCGAAGGEVASLLLLHPASSSPCVGGGVRSAWHFMRNSQPHPLLQHCSCRHGGAAGQDGAGLQPDEQRDCAADHAGEYALLEGWLVS